MVARNGGNLVVNVIRKPTWALNESLATPEDVFLNRRQLVKGVGMAGLGLAAAMALKPGRAFAAENATADLYPAERNAAYTIEARSRRKTSIPNITIFLNLAPTNRYGKQRRR